MFQRWDYVAVSVYMVFMVILGYVAKRKVKGLEDYFTGGHNVPWWLAAISHHVSSYSAFVFVALGSKALANGFSTWTYFAGSCFIGTLVAALVWAPLWAKLRVSTPVEYLAQRYNNATRQLWAWTGIALKFVDEGAKLYSLSVIVHVCTGIRLELVVVVTGAVTVAYLLFGGLWATILTDFVQFIVQFAVTLVLVPLVLKAAGGWSGIWAVQPEKLCLFAGRFGGDFDVRFVGVMILVMTLSLSGGTWGLAQRFYSIGDPAGARKAALVSAGLYLVYPIALLLPVWAAPVILSDVAGFNPEHAYILVAHRLLGPLGMGLMGVLVCAMFAATMSMVDSDINALAAVFTRDIFQGCIKPDAKEQTVFRVGLISTVVLGAMVICSALLIVSMEGESKAFNAMLQWYAALLGPVSIPLLFGMILRRGTWRGAVGSWVFGFAAVVLGKHVLGWSFPVYTAVELAVALSVFVAEGYLFRRTDAEEQRVSALFARLRQ